MIHPVALAQLAMKGVVIQRVQPWQIVLRLIHAIIPQCATNQLVLRQKFAVRILPIHLPELQTLELVRMRKSLYAPNLAAIIAASTTTVYSMFNR